MSDSKQPGRDVPRATDARSSMEGAQNGREPRPAGHAAGTGAPSHPGHRGSAGTHKPLQIKIGGSAAPHRYSATGGQRPARPHASAGQGTAAGRTQHASASSARDAGKPGVKAGAPGTPGVKKAVAPGASTGQGAGVKAGVPSEPTAPGPGSEQSAPAAKAQGAAHPAAAHPRKRPADAGRPHAQAPSGRAASPSGRAVRAGVAPAARTPRYVHPHRQSSQRTPLIAAGAALVIVIAAALGIGYQFFWRSVEFSVNGEERTVQINTSVQQLLEDNDYFGVKAGRLLSVGGNVISEDGGDRCAVTFDGEQLEAEDLVEARVVDDSQITVADGADAVEPYKEETVDALPGIQMDGSGAIQFVSQWGKAGKKVVWTGEQSGETVDKEVIEEPVDMVVSALNPKPKGDKKYIALTFDDGPSGYTDAILAILKEKNAKATFFNLGGNAGARSKTVVDNGNQLASHTNQHMNLPTCDRDTLRSEITTAADAIEQASGVRPQMIRAPYGAFTATEWARSADLISCNVLWNIDTLDWKLPGASSITNNVLTNAYNGAIALMHDGGGNRSQDVEALPAIIDGLRADGYELVTVSDLMELDGRFPEDVVNGTVEMPEDAALPAL